MKNQKTKKKNYIDSLLSMHIFLTLKLNLSNAILPLLYNNNNLEWKAMKSPSIFICK